MMQNPNELLVNLKNFMIDLYSQLNQPPIVNPQHIDTIDRAAIQIKTNQQNVASLQNQNAQFGASIVAMNDSKRQCQHLNKILSQKKQQIGILNQTIKTLYADNQKMVKEKQDLSKEAVTLKEQVTSLKKKIKRQQDQMSNHKTQLQKLSTLAQQKLNQYVKQDQQKLLKIKRLQSEVEKSKSDLAKKQKIINNSLKKLDEYKVIQNQYESALALTQNLKYQNNLLKNQLQSIKQKVHNEKVKYLQQNESLLKQIQQINEKNSGIVSQKQELELRLQSQLQKILSYEQQIVMRTQKLKQKNKQIKVYNQQIQKLVKRVKQLSQMADDVMNQNRQLSEKCKVFEQKLEQFKLLYSHVGKLKGEINQKKSVQFGRLIDSINKLQASL